MLVYLLQGPSKLVASLMWLSYTVQQPQKVVQERAKSREWRERKRQQSEGRKPRRLDGEILTEENLTPGKGCEDLR